MKTSKCKKLKDVVRNSSLELKELLGGGLLVAGATCLVYHVVELQPLMANSDGKYCSELASSVFLGGTSAIIGSLLVYDGIKRFCRKIYGN